MNVSTPLINFIVKFSVPWKRQQIRYGATRWSHHSRRPKIGLVVQPNKFPNFDQTGGGGAKKPFFHFTTVSIGGTDKAGKVGAVSLSRICALIVIADKEELKKASPEETEDLFEGVK